MLSSCLYWWCFSLSKIDMYEDKVVPCFEIGSEWAGLIASFQQLGYWKVKVRCAFQFQESSRILLSRVQNGISRGAKGLFLLHFLFWLVLLVALHISANIRILSKSKPTFRLKCMHHGFGGRCTRGKGFLVIMITFGFFLLLNNNGSEWRFYQCSLHKTDIFCHVCEK